MSVADLDRDPALSAHNHEVNITVSVVQGEMFEYDPEAPETVNLSLSKPISLFSQRPRVFSVDSKKASSVQAANEAYLTSCDSHDDPAQIVLTGTQTRIRHLKTKGVSTQSSCFHEVAVSASEAAIYDAGLRKEAEQPSGAQQVPQTGKRTATSRPDTQGRPESPNPSTARFSTRDETETVYTVGTEDGLSEAGTVRTTYTVETARTAMSLARINRLGGTRKTEQDISFLQQKVLLNQRLPASLRLAELLALQRPVFHRVKSFLGADVDVNPDVDYERKLAVDVYSPTLTLEPLWTLDSHHTQGMSVTAAAFSPASPRALALGYSGHGRLGRVAVWLPANPFHPSRLISIPADVTSLAWLPNSPSTLAVGASDGGVMLFDLREGALVTDGAGMAQPVIEATHQSGRHTAAVWSLAWAAGESGGREGDETVQWDLLVSVSADGRVVERSLKRNFEHRDILALTAAGKHPVAMDTRSRDSRMTIVRKLSEGLSLSFSADLITYLVPTDDGRIRRASRTYTEQYLQSYEGHISAVYAAEFSPFVPDVFVSCSADRTARLWTTDSSEALLVVGTTTEDHLHCVKWCPFLSTLMATGSRSGHVELWDFAQSSVTPILIIEPLEPVSPVEVLAFNPDHPVLAVGYGNGKTRVYRIGGLETSIAYHRIAPKDFHSLETDRFRTMVSQRSEEKEEGL
eukprot:gnl/Dysnectes_brevis/5121_a7225_223.p1 GENE.gnl/Dysnectes_brevis/5121_a7225_223~~gnl/Dysnectes_brevis/5121_a7225_223.p1  ORF type:complete len:689 (+),score=253.29 gnl/Dysnectes_brevis/5121_a7225_223:13-2079(+)